MEKKSFGKTSLKELHGLGGLYKSLVKPAKEYLGKIIGNAFLSYEEMSILLAEVEAILNQGPLIHVYNDNDELQPLTPIHVFFLNFGKELLFPINFSGVIEDGLKSSAHLKRKSTNTC